jgi:DNA-binding GntR family transcriptional regulator
MNDIREAIIPVREQVYNRIKSAILSNEYKPGDIIQIDRLAREMGISATPIREAIIRLESSGLLELIPNKGARVVEITPRDIREIWELRLVLEPYAAKQTALLDVQEEIEELEGQIRTLMEGEFDHDTYTDADDRLHRLLFDHVDNSVMRETIDRIHSLSMRLRYHAENVSSNSSDVVQTVCSEHLAILEALKKKDPEATEAAVRDHLKNGEQRTLASAEKKMRSADETP